MKIGKLSQTILKRSLLKPLQYRREDALLSPAIEEMCYGIAIKPGEQILSTETVLYGNEKNIGIFALAQVANDLATRGARIAGVGVHILLPPYAYESRLKSMMEHMEEAAALKGIQVLSAKGEVSSVISSAILSMQGVGILRGSQPEISNCPKECGGAFPIPQPKLGKPDQDIVLLKWIGLEGTLRAMNAREEDLRQRFVPTFLSNVKALQSELFSEQEIELAVESGATALQQITSGGILATLWEMAEGAGVGLVVDLKKMSIRQETVEICEFCHLNPYQLTSAGSVLIFTDRGEDLVEKYAEMGTMATLLGRTTAEKERVILGGEEKRFLDRPAPDELVKLFEN